MELKHPVEFKNYTQRLTIQLMHTNKNLQKDDEDEDDELLQDAMEDFVNISPSDSEDLSDILEDDLNDCYEVDDSCVVVNHDEAGPNILG